MIWDNIERFPEFNSRGSLKVILMVLVGILFGALVVCLPFLPLPADWQTLAIIFPFVFALVMVVRNLQRLILFAIAISIPLNLDFSILISPFARNAFNLAQGNRTLVALTELRLSLTLILVLIGYVLWLGERSKVGKRDIRFSAGTSIPALGIIFFSLLSVFQAQDSQLTFFRIVQLVELFLAYFYLINHIRTKEEMGFFIKVLMWAMLLESLLMIIQWFTNWSFSIAGIHAGIDTVSRRAAGTLGTVGTASGFVSAVVILIGAVIWIFPKRSEKIFAMVCFVMGCAALITTGGRAAWGSFVLSIMLFVFLGWRRGWIRAQGITALAIIVLLIGIIAYPVIYNRLTADDGGSAASRPMMFTLAWNVITASPSHLFLGVGANNYALIAHRYNSAGVGYLGYVIDSSVHNAYLLAWAETGIPGLVAFLWFLIAPLIQGWKRFWSGDRFVSLLALGLVCAVFALEIQMLVDPFIARPKSLLIWLMIALIVCLKNFDREPFPQLQKGLV